MAITPRQQRILQMTVAEHIRTGIPVGSETVLRRSRLPVSAATVRAELVSLEEAGYITHPYTSAGRIPTAAGYRYYVDHWVEHSPHARAAAHMERMDTGARDEAFARELARALARLSGTLALVARHDAFVHEAGLGQLIRMRELAEESAAEEVERLVDVLAERPSAVPTPGDAVAVYINGEIPVIRTNHVSMVVGASALPSGQSCLAVLVGPLRMPYEHHVGVLEALHRAFSPERP